MNTKARILTAAFALMGLSALVIAAEQKAIVRQAADEPGWGPAVDGVQCRLLADKDRWQATEIPKLKAYVRDPKGRQLQLVNAPHLRCQLEVDGLWHRWSGPQWSSMLVGYYPSDWIVRRGGYMLVSLDEACWENVQSSKPLELSPGKHIVRFGWAEHEREQPVRLISNPVEIEILPSPGGIKQMSDHEKRRRQVIDLFHQFTRGEQLTEVDKKAGLKYDLTSELQPKFAWSDIPCLLELAETTINARRIPKLMTSSHIQRRCREGMIALWLIEGLRRGQADVIRKQTGHASGLPGNPICRKGEKQNSENSPSLHDEVLKAYKIWWRTVRALPPEAAALFYPLDLTDLKWGGDRRLDALQIYDEMTPDNTIAQRTVRAWQYAGDGYKPDPIVQTIYYTLKDPSAQPPFTREMLTVQKTVLHFYDEKGREIRTQKYLPASGTETGSRKEAQNTSRAEATPSPLEPARNVSPTLELEGLIIKFEKGIDPERQSVYASVRQSCLEDKKKGKEKDNSAWNSAWMKEPDYYANLDTPELAVECFIMPDPGRFGRELQLRDDPMYAVIMYEVFHNGFAEWFKREDMWKGMLALNEYLSSQIEWTGPEYNPRVSHVSDSFDQIGLLYVIPPLRKQITGREGLFLASCLRVVEKYRKYMENSIRTGDDSLDFFCEPLEVAQLSMLLARQVHPQRYAEIETAITSVRFLDEQNDRDLLSFLTLVVDSLDGFVSEQDYRELDKILGKKVSGPEPVAGPVTEPYNLMDRIGEYVIEDAEEQAKTAKFYEHQKKHWEDYYKVNGRPDWIKDPEYYKNLDTTQLSVDIFSHRPAIIMFENVMPVHENPETAFCVLKAKHYGFREWFEREDMWKGMLSANEYLSSKPAPVAGALTCLRYLYPLSPLREQIQGKERIFLASHLRVLKRFKSYMENHDAQGTFYGEPCWIAARVAMPLAKQIDPQRFAKAKPVIDSAGLPEGEQKIEHVLRFITVVIANLDGFVSEQDYKELDAILTENASPSDAEVVRYGNDRARRVRDLFNSYVRGEEIDEAYLTRRIPTVPKFDWADIPILLELAQSEKDAKTIPHSLESSYHQQRCREGMIALWLIQGLRRKQVALVRQSQTGDENRPDDHYHLTLNPICWKGQRNTDRSGQLQRELLGAFREWWRRFGVLPAEQAALFDPLDLTDLKFGGDPHANFEPLEIYDKTTPDGTIAHTVLRECLYQPQGPRPGRKLRTVYYALKDPSAPPPFTKEMLAVQKVVLYFYDDNGTMVRTKSIYPPSE